MVILITGASHTGKTLLAQRMLERYGYPYLSIDHPKMGLIRSGNTDLTPEDDYIDAHIDSITAHSSDIESRLHGSSCTPDSLKADNRWYFDFFSRCGEQVTVIDEDFEESIKALLV